MADNPEILKYGQELKVATRLMEMFGSHVPSRIKWTSSQASVTRSWGSYKMYVYVYSSMDNSFIYIVIKDTRYRSRTCESGKGVCHQAICTDETGAREESEANAQRCVRRGTS